MFLIMFQCYHDIDPDKSSAARDFFCFLYMLPYRDTVTFCLILLKSLFIISNLCRRDHTNTALPRYRSGETAPADPDSHAALDDWKLCRLFSNVKFFECAFICIHPDFSHLLFVLIIKLFDSILFRDCDVNVLLNLFLVYIVFITTYVFFKNHWTNQTLFTKIASYYTD